jgi:hypothetical protein
MSYCIPDGYNTVPHLLKNQHTSKLLCHHYDKTLEINSFSGGKDLFWLMVSAISTHGWLAQLLLGL